MPALTPARRWCALLALTLGGFAIGATEFVAMGLLPGMARDLLPQLYATHPDDGIARAGWLISAYALGVVVGAPAFAVLGVRMSRTRLLLLLVSLFVLGTLASALSPSFGLVLVARFVAALPHGAYFGAAALVAGSLMGPGHQGKGIAVVLSGLTVSNVVGVPLITRLGQLAGWRVAYLGVTGIFVLTLLAILVAVPAQQAHRDASVRAELRVFRRPQLWLNMTIAAIGFAGFFAIYSYIAEVVQSLARLPEAAVPWVLAAMGLGMTVGSLFGGWAADRNLRRTILVGYPALLGAMAVFALVAQWPVALFVVAFLLGATNLSLMPAIQSRLIMVSAPARLIGAATIHSALNLGNSLGALLGGWVIAAGFGYRAPAWVAVGLGLIGLALTLVSFSLERRPRYAVGPPVKAAPALSSAG